MTMNHTAAETADVMLAIDDLPAHSRDMLIHVFAAMQNKSDSYTESERAFFNAILRLIARVREMREQTGRMNRRAERGASMPRPVSAETEWMRDEFAALTANLG
jgi:hypothetical protein